MSSSTEAKTSKSIVLELVIAVLVVILLTTILYPKKLWKEQEQNTIIARERLENLYYASDYYKRSTRSYTNDLQELLAFAEAGSIKVNPPGFRMDRLTLPESGVDSFQVEFFDPYPHFNHFQPAIKYSLPTKDSLYMEIVPKPEFDFAPRTSYSFKSQNPINVMLDDRGVQGVYLMVGSAGEMTGTQVLGEPIMERANKYIYSIPEDGIGICPTSGEPAELSVNVKMDIIAEIRCSFKEDSTSTPLKSSKLLSSIAVYRMIRESDGRAQRKLEADAVIKAIEDSIVNARNTAFLDKQAEKLRAEGLEDLAIAIYDSVADSYGFDEATSARWEAIKEDSYALQNGLPEKPEFQKIRDDLVNDIKSGLMEEYLNEKIKEYSSKKTLDFSEVGTINTTSDSIGFYSSPQLIKSKLFKEHKDPITTKYMNRDDIGALLSSFHARETYRVSRVDSTGLTIACPIEGRYKNPNPSLLERIFGVEGAENHGHIERGDRSWSENK